MRQGGLRKGFTVTHCCSKTHYLLECHLSSLVAGMERMRDEGSMYLQSTSDSRCLISDFIQAPTSVSWHVGTCRHEGRRVHVGAPVRRRELQSMQVSNMILQARDAMQLRWGACVLMLRHTGSKAGRASGQAAHLSRPDVALGEALLRHTGGRGSSCSALPASSWSGQCYYRNTAGARCTGQVHPHEQCNQRSPSSWTQLPPPVGTFNSPPTWPAPSAMQITRWPLVSSTCFMWSTTASRSNGTCWLIRGETSAAYDA